jgi:tRNA G37 N-methylase Trm5
MDILIFPSLIELNPIVLKEADSWGMRILLNSLSAYGDAYEENQNVINLKLDINEDKKTIQYAHMYCPQEWSSSLYKEIIEVKIYEKEFKIKENDIVLDMGANIGFFAASCSQRNINRCYCFEPMEENFKYLQKNINNLVDSEKFELINKAISPNPEIYIPPEADQFTPYAVEKKEDKHLALPAIKLSDFLE